MDVGVAAVLARVLGVDAAAVAEGAGLALVFPHELVLVDEAHAHPADGGRFHMAVAAGGVTGAAGFLEYLCVEDLRLLLRTFA